MRASKMEDMLRKMQQQMRQTIKEIDDILDREHKMTTTAPPKAATIE